MKQTSAFLSLAALLLTAPQLNGHVQGTFEFPNVGPYQTLICDLHQHTVFSDGEVWPSIRVQEAVREGVDVIAITDHLETQPHARDIPHPDRNRGHAIAVRAARDEDLIVLRGAEITRAMPPGHMNAVFLEDVNQLLQEDPIEVAREANRQGAFVFWNHPAWHAQKPDGVAEITDMHRQLINEGLLHGIEVANEHTYSEEALQIALDNNLAILGTSDVHDLINWTFHEFEDDHRPVTLAFASNRSEAALKQALFAGQTVVYFRETLIGRKEWIVPLLNASIAATQSGYFRKSSLLQVQLKNLSTAPLRLRSVGQFTVHDHAGEFTLPPLGTREVLIRTLGRKREVVLAFEVTNAITAPGQHPLRTFRFVIENAIDPSTRP